jgi:hypothetical protein
MSTFTVDHEEARLVPWSACRCTKVVDEASVCRCSGDSISLLAL